MGWRTWASAGQGNGLALMPEWCCSVGGWAACRRTSMRPISVAHTKRRVILDGGVTGGPGPSCGPTERAGVGTYVCDSLTASKPVWGQPQPLAEPLDDAWVLKSCMPPTSMMRPSKQQEKGATAVPCGWRQVGTTQAAALAAPCLRNECDVMVHSAVRKPRPLQRPAHAPLLAPAAAAAAATSCCRAVGDLRSRLGRGSQHGSRGAIQVAALAPGPGGREGRPAPAGPHRAGWLVPRAGVS
jgi:hypothetical protein